MLEETYVEVLGVNVTVLGKVEVLLGNEDTLAEEVLVNELAVRLGNEPGWSISAFHPRRIHSAQFPPPPS